MPAERLSMRKARSPRTSTPRPLPAMMQMVGSFAEFERAMIRERTLAGVAAARAEGRVGGQRPTLTEAQRADVAENLTSGRRTAAQMARGNELASWYV